MASADLKTLCEDTRIKPNSKRPATALNLNKDCGRTPLARVNSTLSFYAFAVQRESWPPVLRLLRPAMALASFSAIFMNLTFHFVYPILPLKQSPS